jgi:hypothetical protein
VTKNVIAFLESKNSETAQAMATPSSLLVALPSSSRRISDPADTLLQMKAVSFISNINDEMLFSVQQFGLKLQDKRKLIEYRRRVDLP